MRPHEEHTRYFPAAMHGDVPGPPPVWHGVFQPPPGALLVVPASGRVDWPWITPDGTPHAPWCHFSALEVTLGRLKPAPAIVVLCSVHNTQADHIQHARRAVAMALGCGVPVGLQGDMAALGCGDRVCAASARLVLGVPRSAATPPIVPPHSEHVATMAQAWAWLGGNCRPDETGVVVTLEPEMAVQHHGGGVADLRKPGRWVFATRLTHGRPQRVTGTGDAPVGFVDVGGRLVTRCDTAQATYVTPAQFRQRFGWVDWAVLLVDVPLALKCRVAARCRRGVLTVRSRRLDAARVPFAGDLAAGDTQGPKNAGGGAGGGGGAGDLGGGVDVVQGRPGFDADST